MDGMVVVLQTPAPKYCHTTGVRNWNMRCHDLLLFSDAKSVHPMQQYAAVPMDSSSNSFWPATRLAPMQYGSDVMQHNMPTHAAIPIPSGPSHAMPGFSHSGEFLSQGMPFQGPNVQHPALRIPQLRPSTAFVRSSVPHAQLPPSDGLNVQASAHILAADVDPMLDCKCSDPHGDVKPNKPNAQNDKTTISPIDPLEVSIDSESESEIDPGRPCLRSVCACPGGLEGFGGSSG